MLTDDDEARRLVETYSNQLLRLAYSLLNSVPDAQDVCQEVLLKRLTHPKDFESEIHEKAWLVRVAVNMCKNLRRSSWHRRTVGLDEVGEQAAFCPQAGGILDEVQALPAKHREVIVLYYYMGYDSNEIAAFLGIRVEAVRARLARARKKLKQGLEEQGYDGLSN